MSGGFSKCQDVSRGLTVVKKTDKDSRAHMDQNGNASLAPAAGTGIGKLVFDGLLARADFIPLMIEAMIGGLRATTTFYNPSARTTEDKPDYKLRVHTVIALFAHAEGEPIKRIVHQHLGAAGGAPDLLAALREDPALLEAVERQVEKAKFHGRHLRKAEPVEEVPGVICDKAKC